MCLFCFSRGETALSWGETTLSWSETTQSWGETTWGETTAIRSTDVLILKKKHFVQQDSVTSSIVVSHRNLQYNVNNLRAKFLSASYSYLWWIPY